MGNLIRAEFYRLRRRPHSVLGMALILLLGVSLLTVSCALPPQVGSAATLLQSISTLSVSGMFLPSGALPPPAPASTSWTS